MLTNEIAIVGIDSQFAEFANIDRVARALYVGKEVGKEVGKGVDKGLDEDLGNEISIANTTIADVINDSSARMLGALSISELAEQEHNNVLKQLDMIVISEQSLDLDNNVKIEAHINSINVVSQLSEALTLALSLLDKGSFVALVGLNITSLNKGVEQNTPENTVQNNKTISFDSHFSGYQSTSGIASLLLAPKLMAQQTQLPIYAQLNGLSISAVNASAMKAAVLESLKSINQQRVALVEVSALEDEFHSELESSVLLEAYRDVYAGEVLTRAISCVRSITGEGAGFSQVLGLLRTVIALQQRYIPGINNWQTPKAGHLVNWQSSSFYFPTESRTRYPNADGSLHSAAYSCLTQDSYCHLVLSEHALESKDEDIRLNGFLASSELHLVLVNGEDEAELQQKLSQLASLLPVKKGHDDLKLMADQQYQQYLTTSTKKYSIALLAESNDELTKEIQLAQQGIKNVFVNLSQAELGKATSSDSTQWKTPKGSFFSAEPAVQQTENSAKSTSQFNNNVCFMYPGIGATYVGLGRDLFQLFPEIYTDVANLADDIGSSLKDTLLNPRSISRLDFKALKQRDLDLRGNLADIAEAGVGFACVFSKIFTKVFKLNADFATGYSMGEVSMYAALGCWQQPGLMSARLANSATFNERLCGDLLTLREHWDLPLPNSKTEVTEAPIWETYTIKATLAQVEAACIDETRVYCTIINTPDSVLLAGFPADCLRVIDKLGVRAMALNMANAIHSAPAKAEYDDMVALYTMAVNARINTKLYSSSCYLPVPQLSKAIAHSIAKCLCDRVDFPRLVNTLYNNGARVFIEMGPGRSLCSWVDKTLEHEHKQPEHKQQHNHQQVTQVKDGSSKTSVSVPVNAKGVSDELTYFRAIAKLVSHGVKLDLNSLFYGSIVINKKTTNKVMATTDHSANKAQKNPASQGYTRST
ncbi:PfaB family protein [Colwellia sp. 12G3]|uniref:PfaB family protein n=1 Tax=Colwellia sp. 12G3 TaxID=2058299 RepID=UPI000C3480A7|nr:PfaB family protein [Colwellia sp. 12G3]PKI16015.1 PfaB family protein [Colwellia sp. 12G3]